MHWASPEYSPLAADLERLAGNLAGCDGFGDRVGESDPSRLSVARAAGRGTHKEAAKLEWRLQVEFSATS